VWPHRDADNVSRRLMASNAIERLQPRREGWLGLGLLYALALYGALRLVSDALPYLFPMLGGGP
jgi:hypothetical protein